MERKRAGLYKAGYLVAECFTTVSDDETVSYGFNVRTDGHGRRSIHEVGEAKVRRDEKALDECDRLVPDVAYVNYGYGDPI